MANIARNRILREVSELKKDTLTKGENYDLQFNEDNVYRMQATIFGPDDTPYAGGKYRLDITIPEVYPFSPPKVVFITKVWHPNISSQSGAICLDILKDAWAAAMSIRTVLLSIQALLGAPEPDDPQDAVVASQYKESREMFLKTAQHWAAVYASAPDRCPELRQKVQHIASMGFPENDARTALSTCKWNIETALEFLLR
jgi:ubiquitin-conjugating enzyme (huntingtin interacting protein 2)